MKNHSLRFPFKILIGLLASYLMAGFAMPAQQSRLGVVEFPNSGAPEAQQPFIRGILLLHSFEYEDAAEAFREAQKIDPNFSLAYWGEAMTYNHPLWLEQDLARARAALDRLAPTPEERLKKTPTEKERGYLRAAEILFGEGSKTERDEAFSEAMEKLYRSFPDDLEIASFYALSILGTAQGKRDFRTYMKAAAVVEEVFDSNPRHPGALHYLIHSYDDPIHAPLGLRPARVYAQVAPAATHAQHMISHIYMALGRWEENNEANRKSLAVSEQRLRDKGLPLHRRSHHALHWLAYGYLQQGQFEKARQLLKIMQEDAAAEASASNLWYLAEMRANFIVETEVAEDPPAGASLEGIRLSAVAADLFATGLAAVRSGDLEKARQMAAQIGSRRSAESSGLKREDTYKASVPSDWVVAEILENELEALIAFQQGEKNQAFEQMAKAVSLEDGLPFDYGPPEIVKPSHELYGELLLKAGRFRDAQKHFEKALERYPRRSRSLLGLARAAASAGDLSTADQACVELDEVWQQADPEVARLLKDCRQAGGEAENR